MSFTDAQTEYYKAEGGGRPAGCSPTGRSTSSVATPLRRPHRERGHQRPGTPAHARPDAHVGGPDDQQASLRREDGPRLAPGLHLLRPRGAGRPGHLLDRPRRRHRRQWLHARHPRQPLVAHALRPRGRRGRRPPLAAATGRDPRRRGSDPAACEVPAGHCHFHHCRTFHGSYGNSTGNPRRSYIMHLMPGHTRRPWGQLDRADGERGDGGRGGGAAGEEYPELAAL